MNEATTINEGNDVMTCFAVVAFLVTVAVFGDKYAKQINIYEIDVTSNEFFIWMMVRACAVLAPVCFIAGIIIMVFGV